LLCAERPFKGETGSDMIAAILEREPDWTALPATIPGGIRRLLKRCIEKDPKRRVHDIADARIELDDVLSGEASSIAQPEPAASRRSSLRHPVVAWSIAAVLLVTCVALLALAWFRTSSAPAAVTLFLPPPEGTRYAIPILGGPVSVSPDGKRLAFAAVGDDGVQRLLVRSLDSPSAAFLPGTEGASFPFWSPNSQSIGFFVPGKLKRIDASGGPAQELCPAVLGRGGTWNKEGVILFAPAVKAGLWRVSDRGGGVATRLDGFHEDAVRFPAFLPDGRHFLYHLGLWGGDTYLGSLDAGAPRLLIADSSNVAYAPPGYVVFVKNRTLVAQLFDIKALALTGPPIPVADAVAYMDGPRLGDFTVSETVLAYRGVAHQSRVRLDLVDRNGNTVRTVGEPDVYSDFQLSADDLRVAFVRPDAQGTDQIWVLDIRNGVPVRLTDGAVYEDAPIWSGNGHVVFSRDGGLGGLAQIDVNTIGEMRTVVGESTAGKSPYGMSRDERLMLYGLGRDQNRFELWAHPAGAKDFQIHNMPSDQHDVQLSPDGERLAYVSSESGSARVYVRNFSRQPTDSGYELSRGHGTRTQMGARRRGTVLCRRRQLDGRRHSARTDLRGGPFQQDPLSTGNRPSLVRNCAASLRRHRRRTALSDQHDDKGGRADAIHGQAQLDRGAREMTLTCPLTGEA
jgi:Tol biopolymer transport system component